MMNKSKLLSLIVILIAAALLWFAYGDASYDYPSLLAIGVGGTLAKYSEEGHDVTGIIVTLPQKKKVRRKESMIAAEILGININVLGISFDDFFFSREIHIIKKAMQFFEECIFLFFPCRDYLLSNLPFS